MNINKEYRDAEEYKEYEKWYDIGYEDGYSDIPPRARGELTQAQWMGYDEGYEAGFRDS